MLGSAQAPQLGRGLDPAPICPVPEQIGSPPPKNVRQAGISAEHSQNRPALLYLPVSFVQIWPDFRPIIFFLLRLGGRRVVAPEPLLAPVVAPLAHQQVTVRVGAVHGDVDRAVLRG